MHQEKERLPLPCCASPLYLQCSGHRKLQHKLCRSAAYLNPSLSPIACGVCVSMCVCLDTESFMFGPHYASLPLLHPPLLHLFQYPLPWNLLFSVAICSVTLNESLPHSELSYFCSSEETSLTGQNTH